VVDAGAVPLLVLCIQEPELSLKRIAASALSDICKHSPELAQTVVDAGAIAHLAQMILNPDAKLKVNVAGDLLLDPETSRFSELQYGHFKKNVLFMLKL
jgi:hypothetical protein